jgi:ribosomal protein S18 acetylase RimI-like enzyme
VTDATQPQHLIRRGGHGDVPFMRSMLTHAYNWRVSALDAEIPLARYVEAWGREGDVALIATETGHRVGAAWFRLFPSSAPGYGFVDEQTPELTISVVPSRRKHGVGHELLEELVSRAGTDGYPAISLSVEDDSPAVSFYERHGFDRVGENAGAITMRRAL